ncbi:hypothetical protein O6H91_21G056600 [Diphasiastrum complanatum]|uniref:Uncharacterized protein n=1 Tax=Diphasiastrum complanatum TaxID=34168 RepID=A0ACC2AKQ7_DIPCM|nr:hypothetical protein O6H91_21G056600 [Diphasiastrum complanatum]
MALLQATRLHALLLPPSPSRPAKELALRSSRELPLLPQPHASTRRSLSHSSASLMTRQLIIRATNADTDKVDTTIPNVTPKRSDSSSLNQLLGIKGAAKETNKWKIRLQLTKPVTWAPLIWGVVCGAAASGNFQWTLEDVAKSLTAMLVAGPLLTGYTQTINDWYDREIDAINEPYRPIPSGAISESEVFTQIWVLLISGLALAYGLDVWAGHSFPVIFSIALGGAFLSYIYSAPPLKLKQSGWIGNYALGSSYISLPWWTGQALFGSLSPDVMILTLLYSTAGLGIAIVNDFKSIEGDRAMGLQSLPVAFGVDTAKWICAGSIDITQISVAGYLIYTGKLYYGLALLGLIAPQVIFQASAQPFFVLGLLVTALAVSH